MISKIGRKTKVIAVFFLAAIPVLLYANRRDESAKECYLKVTSGMTLDEVQAIMGRPADEHDSSLTSDGEFERSWSFPESRARLTVVFNASGLSRYKEHGPIECGTTPLGMRKR
jgi:hypothetical protein